MFLNTFEHLRNVKCGLVYYGKHSVQEPNKTKGDKALPVQLESVDLRATVVHAAAEIIVTQTYINDAKKDIDTFYYFPLHSGDVVTGFEMEIDNVILKNLIVREATSESRKAYAEAIKAHPQRFWTDPQDTSDSYQTRIGLLQPGSRVTITIAYITELKLKVDKIELQISNIVVPRYKNNEEDDRDHPPVEETAKKKVTSVLAEEDEEIECVDLEEDENDGTDKKESTDSVSPPKNACVPEVIPKVKIHVEFLMEGEFSISLLECDSHVPKLATIDHLSKRDNWTTAKITFEGIADDMENDFAASITPADVLVPKIYVEATEDETVLMSTFCPILALPSSPDQHFVFLIDSSLNEHTNMMMHRVVPFLLMSLRPKSTFNMICPSQNFLFPESQKAHINENMRKAKHFMSTYCKYTEDDPASIQPEPTSTMLENVFVQFQTAKFTSQLVLVLEKSIKLEELQLCEALVKRHSKSHKFRLFVIGIGHAVSPSQLQRLALAGEGVSVQIPITKKTDVSWQGIVTELMALADSPSLSDVRLTWSDWEERSHHEKTTLPVEDVEILSESAGSLDKLPWLQVPEDVNSIFSGTQFVTFGIFIHKFYPRHLHFQGTSFGTGSENLEFKYDIQLKEPREYYTGSVDIITKLAYTKGLKQLEAMIPKHTSCQSRKVRNDVLKTKEKILHIATREGIPSKYTYFATVDLESGTEVKGHWTRYVRFMDNDADVGSPSSSEAWAKVTPYGSIARNKLSSIRKLPGTDQPLVKIQRTAVKSGASELIDLTDD